MMKKWMNPWCIWNDEKMDEFFMDGFAWIDFSWMDSHGWIRMDRFLMVLSMDKSMV
jgi:hypothetical protein